MFKQKFLAVFAMGMVCFQASAQDYNDVFRYSRTGIVGSPRSLGLGGAWGAVGADMSSASINPAGLGFYRRSEFLGSVGINSVQSNTTFGGGTTTDSRTNFNIPNIGLVFTSVNQYKGHAATEGVVSGSFAFGMNRLADYNQNVNFSGTNHNSSIGNSLATQATNSKYDSSLFWGADFDNTLYALAWRLTLIDNYNGSNRYVGVQDRQFDGTINKYVGDTGYNMHQNQNMQLKGRMNEWYASGGINISNLFYLGASLILHDASYSSEIRFRENVQSSSLAKNRYISSAVSQSLTTTGSGVGGRFGIIVRPVDFFRFGIAYQTPVRMNMSDYYQNALQVVLEKVSYSQPSSPRQDYYKYQIITPGKLTASMAFPIQKYGLISADMEQIDYRQGRLSASDYDFSDRNTVVYNTYNVARNFRFGAEYNLPSTTTKIRVGYSILGNPYNPALVSNAIGNRQVYSAGFGWIYNRDYFFDFAVNNTRGTDIIVPYDGSPINAENKYSRLMFTFGGGVRF